MSHLSFCPKNNYGNILIKNNLKKFREDLMMSKAELARKAKISPITIARIENGMPCRLETMRKLIRGLDKKISDKNDIFPNN